MVPRNLQVLIQILNFDMKKGNNYKIDLGVIVLFNLITLFVLVYRKHFAEGLGAILKNTIRTEKYIYNLHFDYLTL